jgi:hypothetical protein
MVVVMSDWAERRAQKSAQDATALGSARAIIRWIARNVKWPL